MDLESLPRHLLVIGGGYIGCELGQMFRRFGAGVTILEAKIAYRRGDYVTARKHVAAVKPVFTRPNAERYQRTELETLERQLDTVP